jgi:hypothetical protein
MHSSSVAAADNSGGPRWSGAKLASCGSRLYCCSPARSADSIQGLARSAMGFEDLCRPLKTLFQQVKEVRPGDWLRLTQARVRWFDSFDSQRLRDARSGWRNWSVEIKLVVRGFSVFFQLRGSSSRSGRLRAVSRGFL